MSGISTTSSSAPCAVLASPSYVWHLPGMNFFIFAVHLIWERQIRQPLTQPAPLALASISLSTSSGIFLPGNFPLLAS